MSDHRGDESPPSVENQTLSETASDGGENPVPSALNHHQAFASSVSSANNVVNVAQRQLLTPGAEETFSSLFSSSSSSSSSSSPSSEDLLSDEQVAALIEALAPFSEHVALPASTIEADILHISKDVKKYMDDDGIPVEDTLLDPSTTMTKTLLTPENYMKLITESPTLSYLVVAGRSHLEENHAKSLGKAKEYAERAEITKKFMDWQEKQVQDFKKKIQPTDDELEQVNNDIAELEKKLHKLKAKKATLDVQAWENHRRLTAEEKIMSEARSSRANADRLYHICNSIAIVAGDIAEAHDNPQKRHILIYASMNTPQEMGSIAKIPHYAALERVNTSHAIVYMRVLFFFGYQFSGAFRMVYPTGMPCVDSNFTKPHCHLILCRLFGIDPPGSLILKVEGDGGNNKSKRKRSHDTSTLSSIKKVRPDEAYQELISKAHPDDVKAACLAAKHSGGHLGKLLFDLFVQRLKNNDTGAKPR